MKLATLLSTTLAAAFALTLCARAATPLVNLVDENAVFVYSIHDTPALVKTFKNGPYLKLWENEQIKKYLAPLRTKLKADDWNDTLKTETGYTIEEFYGLIQGDAVVSVKTLDLAEPPELFFAAEIGDNKDKIEKLFSTLAGKKKATVQTETYADATINIVTMPAPASAQRKTDSTAEADDDDMETPQPEKPNTLCWAVTDKVFILTLSKDSIIAKIEALKKGGLDNPFGKSTRYLHMMENTHQAPVMYVFNIQSLYPLINTALAARANSPTQDAAMIDYTNLARSLGLDALNDIYIGVHYNDDNDEISGAFTYGEKRGLLKFLAFTNDAVEIPAFVSAKWPTASVTNFSIPDAYAAFEEVLAMASPNGSKFINPLLLQYNQKLGIDLKRDLIGSIGTQITTANLLPPGVSNDDANVSEKLGTIYVISLKDARTFDGALQAIIRANGMDTNPNIATQREYLGTTITTLKAAQNTKQQFSYAIAKNQFIIGLGAPNILDPVVQNLTKGADEQMKNRADIRSHFSNLPAKTVGVGVQNTAFMLRYICDLVGKFPNMGEYVDPAAIPALETFEKYFGTSYTWGALENDGYYFNTTIVHQK